MISNVLRNAVIVAVAAVVLAGCTAQGPGVRSREPARSRVAVVSSRVIASDGSLVADLHGEIDRNVVPITDVPVHVRNAVIAAEDERFWKHWGVDPVSVVRALLANIRGQKWETVQGGSTLSQQLVKNAYFPRGERTVLRKTLEAALAFGLERSQSKRRILELYLNTVYFGRGAYGVQAAGKAYFGKPAGELSVSEGAFLAGVIHSPGRYDLRRTLSPADRKGSVEESQRRRDWVLSRMGALGLLTEKAAASAEHDALDLLPVPHTRWQHPYFVDLVLRQLGVIGAKDDAALDRRFDAIGRTIDERGRRVYEGGLEIFTTVDLRVQDAAELAVAEVLGKETPRLSAAIAVVEPATGAIRALVGGRDYYPAGCPDDMTGPGVAPDCRIAKVNLALGARGGGSGRQPGSGFKPFVLATALENGLSLGDRFSSSPFTAKIPPAGEWKVRNYEGPGRGSMQLLDATVDSVNAVFARLEIEGIGGGDAIAGSRKVAATARKFGMPFASEDELKARCGERINKSNPCTPADLVPAIALGAKEVSPLTFASAYGVFANDGVHVEPFAISRIVDASGRTLYQAKPRSERAVSAEVARTVTHALREVVEQGTGRSASLGSRPVAGKTGTSQQWRDAWFNGYTPQLAATVWVGNPTPVRRRSGVWEVESMTPQFGYRRKVVGGSYPAAMWKRLMQRALEGREVADFPDPPPGIMKPTRTPRPDPSELLAPHGLASGTIPGVVGMSVAAAVSRIHRAGYWASLVPACGPGSPLSVFSQSPGGGAIAPRGRDVAIFYKTSSC